MGWDGVGWMGQVLVVGPGEVDKDHYFDSSTSKVVGVDHVKGVGGWGVDLYFPLFPIPFFLKSGRKEY